mmetsp:Transcript_39494/g.111995  ORF Transcript_39494/g.111995 Transcript_39494/m.111995 type:complete len:242 (-) Transcript_39494:267-992(-)
MPLRASAAEALLSQSQTGSRQRSATSRMGRKTPTTAPPLAFTGVRCASNATSRGGVEAQLEHEATCRHGAARCAGRGCSNLWRSGSKSLPVVEHSQSMPASPASLSELLSSSDSANMPKRALTALITNSASKSKAFGFGTYEPPEMACTRPMPLSATLPTRSAALKFQARRCPVRKNSAQSLNELQFFLKMSYVPTAKYFRKNSTISGPLCWLKPKKILSGLARLPWLMSFSELPMPEVLK